jgi:hypothetical protein
MALRVIIGIDPGVSGGLGVLGLDSGQAVLSPTPTVWVAQNGRRKRRYDLFGMRLALEGYRLSGLQVEVVIERGGTRPGQHAMAVFNTGLGCGLWQGLVVGMGLPYRLVNPVEWKRHQGLLKQDKRASRLLVQDRWPSLGAVGPALEGAAEGLLMADYVRSKEGFHGERQGAI